MSGASSDAVTAMVLAAVVLVVCVIWALARGEALGRRYGLPSNAPLPMRSVVPSALTLAWGTALIGAAAFYVGSLLTPGAGVLVEPVIGMGLASSGVAIAGAGWILLLVDARTQKLPTEVIGLVGACVVAAWGIYLIVLAARGQLDSTAATAAILSPVVGAGIWLLPTALGVRLSGMGKGDLRMAPVLGFALGTTSVPLALVGLMIAFLLAGGRAVILWRRTRTRTTRFAMGPYLLIGAWTAWGWGAVGPVLLV